MTTSPPIVWLFDIDGTLIQSGGAGSQAMQRALQVAFGVTIETSQVEFAGRTDRAITEDLLCCCGVELTESNISMVFAAYRQELPKTLAKTQGEVLPGVWELLTALQDQCSPLGLLTGNSYEGAELKLKHYGLWDFFAFGGFGDVHRDRNHVAAAAVQEAKQHFGDGMLVERNIWVVGDTPHDVSCAKSQGLNAMSVATGSYSYEELLACQPSILVQSLHEVDSLGRIKVGEGNHANRE